MFSKCRFNIKSEKLRDRGLKALKNYQQKWDKANKIFAAKPLHNWASNGADAFMLFAMEAREDKIDRSKLDRQCDNQFDVFDF